MITATQPWPPTPGLRSPSSRQGEPSATMTGGRQGWGGGGGGGGGGVEERLEEEKEYISD